MATNEPLFLGSLPSHLAEWLREEPLPGTAYFICENANTEAANSALISSGLDQIAGHVEANDVIVIDRSSEVGSMPPTRVDIFRSFSSQTGVPLSRIIYASQDAYMPRKIAAAFGGLTCPQHLFFHQYAVGLAKRYAGALIGDLDYDATEKSSFLCLNHKLRPHRAALIASIRGDSALHEQTILSDCQQSNVYEQQRMLSDLARHYPSFASAVASSIREPTPRLGGDLLYSWPPEASRSAVTIVTESDFLGSVLRVTEKSLKPIAYHRPFVIVGPPRCLPLLKAWGFETFSSVFNEEYDTIDDPQDRLATVLDIMRQIQAKDILQQCREICASNQKHFTTAFLDVLRSEFRANMSHALQQMTDSQVHKRHLVGT